ncbi:hypothetical protein G9P44_001870 [Scheffersomyces stipitis]|nr:hypothetical protein G9P44_001870 [Scheffersomyces stipitis]
MPIDSDDNVFDDDDDFIELLQDSSNQTSNVTNEIATDSTNSTNTRLVVPNNRLLEEIPVPKRILGPTHHNIDYGNLDKYVYPSNFEVRDYQFNIVQRAFYHNLLVALPTGLGKTFIASTVMLNFLRWFPESKMIFVAPTKPLVAQQIKACCSITGIPSSKVAILLDKTRKNRGEIWDEKQVFFTTPQVVENDLASGLVDPKTIALLVIDEAHRAKGNYAYNNIVKFMDRFNNSYRILALTATPASDVDGVQEIIDNLNISKVEVRSEESIDIIKYMKRKRIIRRNIYQSDEIKECIDLLCTAIAPVLKVANGKGILEITDPSRINFFQCMDASRKIVANPTIPEGTKWSNFFTLQLLGVVGQCFRRLNVYGLRSFFSYFNEKYTEFMAKHSKKKSSNKLNADFYFSEPIKQLMKRIRTMIDDPKVFSHPKIEAMMEELDEFFTINNATDSKVIIFTEFRESALEIVRFIEKVGKNLKPHIFIGQAKEKDKFDESNFGKKSKGKRVGKKQQDDSKSSSENAQINGMNQKLQKEIIKNFKQGTYNILVATSIGEEGLDIGEVDLIICYDSTSSPIKNIQRMGRTGRKRDGKVVLLFSSNEESKFDKAMNGYEYIQQHIMKGQLIDLKEQNRMIPKDWEPKVEMRFIEIPEENHELQVVDDEDEIIRIATQYMMGGKSKKKKAAASKKGKTKEKRAKQFFMPDNVEIGFRSVTSMVRAVGSSKSLEEEKKEEKVRDVLDRIVDSDSDEEIPLGSIPIPRSEVIAHKQSTTDEQLLERDCQSGSNISDRTLDQHHSASEERGINSNFSHESNLPTPPENSPPKRKSIVLEEACIAKKKHKKSLGIRKPAIRPPSIIDQLKKQKSKIIRPDSANETICLDEDDILLPEYTVTGFYETSASKNENPTDEISQENITEKEVTVQEDRREIEHDDDSEIFDDGLDEQLAMIDDMNTTKSFVEPTRIDFKDEVFKNDFDEHEGFLNNDELMELHTSYFTAIDPMDKVFYYDPSSSVHVDGANREYAFYGKIGHSKRSQVLIGLQKRAHEMAAKSKQSKTATPSEPETFQNYLDSDFIALQ